MDASRGPGRPGDLTGNTGLTLVELVMALALAVLLTAGAALAVAKYGRRDRVRLEASQVVDGLWELRAAAVSGQRNPCMDFPDDHTVRMYYDSSAVPDGFGPGDPLIRSWSYQGGIRAAAIAGGRGDAHAVCFESLGMIGSAGSALSLTLRADSVNVRTVRLLPSTGMAKVK